MKKLLIAISAFCMVVVVSSCGGENKTPQQQENVAAANNDDDDDSDEVVAPSTSDPDRGIGKFTKVEVGPLNAKMAADGEKDYEVKCASCHKMTDEKLVGPGWKGVTTRHTPEWIMNFMTNTDEMLEKDPKAQAMLEICLVRMPNQNLSDDDARELLEFMRKNDGAK